MTESSSKAAARRERILRAASKLFSCYGPAKTTIADIARESEISVGAVYLDFTSKEAVLAALSSQQHETLLAAMQSAVANAEQNLGAQVEAAVVARTRFVCRLAEQATHGCELLHGCQSPVKQAREEHKTQELTLFVDLLTRAKKRGDTTRAPKEAAQALVDAFVSLLPPHLEDEASATKRARRLADLVTHGLLAR